MTFHGSAEIAELHAANARIAKLAFAQAGRSASEAEGELMEIVADGVDAALRMLLPKGMAPAEGPLDQWLFEQLTAAALKAQADGGVWRSGKHVIFSAPTRNQSHKAFSAYLTRLGAPECAAGVCPDGVRALLGGTEEPPTDEAAAHEEAAVPGEAPGEAREASDGERRRKMPRGALLT